MEELGIALITALSSVMTQHQEATLLFAGDAMMHQKQLEVAHKGQGEYDFSDYFTAVAPLVKSADYAVVNLETPLAGGRYSGYPMFNAPDTYADALLEAGFDMMLTANNHTLDRRDKGLRRTIDVLKAKGADQIGTYHSPAARDTLLPMVKNINGFKIGFLNYTYGTNGIDIQGDVVVDYIDRKLIKSDIKKARDKGAELLCVALHWGDEYHLLPNTHQKSLAKYLVDEGVEMVIGGHPHVIQPMEMRTHEDGSQRLVVYSLGNFISNMRTRDTRGGAITRVHLKRDAKGKAYVHSADYDLVFTVPSSGAENFRLVYADSCLSSQWQYACQAFKKAAQQIFTEHNLNINQRSEVK